MNFKSQAKLLLLLAVMFTAAFALSAQSRQVELSHTPNRALLKNNSDLGFDVNYKVGALKIIEVQTQKGTFDELSIEGWGFSTEVGEPKLPMLRKTIAVPLGAEVRLTLHSPQEREMDSKATTLRNPIIPAQAPISKAATTIPFEVNEALYRKNEFNTRDWVEVSELGIMRGVRVFALDFYPVRYNPVTNSIRVLENLDLRVDFINPDLGATADMLAKTASWEFERLYANTIFNWDTSSRTVLVRQPTKMVILCPVGYTNNASLQNYVDWKTQQGIAVSVVSVGNGGNVANTTTAIKNYMQNLWNNATSQNPAPTYLLIIGDESGTNSIVSNAGATGSHVTDLTYVRLSGSDYMPEMYYGRFSVSSATELANIINKTITFEKTQMPNLSYLGKTVLIAGVDATWAPTHGNGAIRYATTQYFNTTHGITSNTYLYPDSQNRAADIIANANDGRGYMVYTAHGSETSWADPTFAVSDVNAMTNSGKYGVMVGNCCITNKFNHSSPCFGEAVIRKANGGGVAYIGGSNNTLWDEDYYWAVGYKPNPNGNAPAYDATKLGAYDAMFHTHGESYDKWATTVGETVYSGNLAVQQSGSSYTNYYWEIYHIMGDPSLMPYMGVPTANPASYSAQITVGDTNYAISGAAPYTRIGLTKDGVIHSSGMTDAYGNANLNISSLNSTGTAKLVLTAQNRITKIADINVVSASGPYVSVSAVAYDDANNDIPEYNESGYLDVTFKNVGMQTATNVSAVLSCSTTGVTIIDANHTISSLAAGASVLADDAFAISIADNVANGTVANFTITMTMSGHNPWTYSFTLTLKAPVLAFGAMTISDPAGNNNGRLDPGETATVTIRLNNNGAASPTGTATLSCTNPGITVNTPTVSFNTISTGSFTSISFTVTAASTMTQGTVISLNFAATTGNYSTTTTENAYVGGLPAGVVLGTGTSSTGTSVASPINVYYQSLHGQSVYTKAELNAAGVIGPIYITQIGFNITGLPTKAMPNYVIRMGHTTASNVANWISTGLTRVWSSTSYQPTATGWNMFTLSTPFLWNGTDNIVVDTAFSLIGSSTSSGTVQYTTVSNGYRYLRNDSYNMTYYFDQGYTSSYRPNLRLTLGSSTVSINDGALTANLRVGTQGTDSFTITNAGNLPLNYVIGMEELPSGASKGLHRTSGKGKSIEGSTLTLNAMNYRAGTTVNWAFTVTNNSQDDEWLQDVIITFPTGVTVNSVTNFVGGSVGDMTPDVTSGNGVTITWHGLNQQGYGFIRMGESATATVNVSVAPSFSGNLTLPWTINGDGWNLDPHTLSGSIVLKKSVSWLSMQPLHGTLAPGASTTFTANFSAVGMAVGTYQALVTIHSNDAVNPNLNLNATMEVWAPDIEAGVSYPASNVTGATFVSSHDLFIVPAGGTTPEIAALPNLDPTTAHIAGYSGTGNNVTLTFDITAAGTWYLIGYWGGVWHDAAPYPLVVGPSSTTAVLSGIDFTAKGDVYVVLSPDNNPTLPVELSHFSATLTAENYVQITWTSQTESNLLGYNVYRNHASELSSAIKVSDLIEGTNTAIAQTYIYVDEELEDDGTYYYWLQDVDMDGTSNYHGPVSVIFSTEIGASTPPIPLVTELGNAYPNPFNPDTNIRYQLKAPDRVKIAVYNTRGQLVRSFERFHDAPGYYKVTWDGRDSAGRALGSGIYLYKMSCGSYNAVKKLVL
ncbi:MAG: C25 family cysteine peptidase, partial [Candidatus Cloacimonadaceae bacterium]